jgi:hypothetical protein
MARLRASLLWTVAQVQEVAGQPALWRESRGIANVFFNQTEKYFQKK